MEKNASLSLYLHIPFCSQRCSYCDFNTYISLDSLREDYSTALAKEVSTVAGELRRPAHTIFFGGGTPSLLTEKDLTIILSTLRDSFSLADDAEITLEANPETLNLPYLKMLRALGINRLSMGAQSANPEELRVLGRMHNFVTVVKAVEMGRAAGFDNINLDLIYGLPDQSLANWEASLKAAVKTQPDHLSLYCLTIEPGTSLFRQLQGRQINSPDPDIAADQYELASDFTTGAGFQQYEISNWALPGRECRHNLSYWRNNEYLGLGAGAHGHAAGYRYDVVKQPRVYIRRMNGETGSYYPWSPAVANKHQLGLMEAMSDTVITQLRLTKEGMDLVSFSNQFKQSLANAFPGKVEQLIELGLLQQKEQRLVLTQYGRLLSNQVFRQFV